MRRPILAALAVLFVGTIVLPGCFYAGPLWWGPDHDEGWEGHHERHERYERHGALTTPQDDRHAHDDHGRRGHADKTVG